MPPARYNYQGRLTDGNGSPLQGTHTVFFSLYRGGSAVSAGSGTLLFKESASLVVENGVANHAVGTGANITGGTLKADMLRTDSDTFLQVAVDTDTNVVLPRARLESVPYATLAENGDARIPLSGPFPIVINQPGSYYLTRSITALFNGDGITINVSDVSIDLSGYALIGIGGSSPNDAIISAADVHRIVISNGTVRSWGGFGINIFGCQGFRIEKVLADSNGSVGIAGGTEGIIRDCIARLCAHGITLGANSIVESCIAFSNTGNGISSSERIIMRRCVARDNGTNGVSPGFFSTVAECIIEGNGTRGINGTTGLMVTNCRVHDSGTDGILGASGTAVHGSIVSLSSGNGIDLGDRALVKDCQVQNSGGNGIMVDDSSRVEHCTVTDSALEGVLFEGSAGTARFNYIDGRSASANSTRSAGHGIRALSSGVSISDNVIADTTTATQAVLGLYVRNQFDNNGSNTGTSSGQIAPVQSVSTATNPFANTTF